MERNYLRKIVHYFANAKWEDFDLQTIHQAKRCLLDYAGCAIFAASFKVAPALLGWAAAMGEGTSAVWGDDFKASPAAAALFNAARTSHIEMDDCSGIGAGVHPGVYVITAALARAQQTDASPKAVLRAMIFGYDVCQRLGMMAGDMVRELGLHGPGMIGGLGAAAASGLLAGLDEEQLYHALSITACLMPVCPFISFIEGTGVKDLYGGWGAYLGMLAVDAARCGITGPEQLLDGEKSLKSILKGQKGKDVKPGEHFYINDIAFKQFSACHSVHPAVNAAIALKERHKLSQQQIARVEVETYPYSYALSSAVMGKLNPSSARLFLPYTIAAALTEGQLTPEAFFEDSLQSGRYSTLMKKVTVKNHIDYGDGPFGIRGSIVTIECNDGRIFSDEETCAKWSIKPEDSELQNKFETLTANVLKNEQRTMLLKQIWGFEDSSVEALVKSLRGTFKEGLFE